MKRKVLTLLLAVTMVLSCEITASALSSSNVRLRTTDYSKSSSTVGDAASVTVYSNNASDSKHKVNAITYGAVAGSSFVKLETRSMDIGTVVSSHSVSGKSSTSSYYLTLNPPALYKGCTAYGTIKCN